MRIKPPVKEKEIEKAIKFLVHSVEECCRNGKPLILHSLRVGFAAIQLQLSQEAIITGFLHDLVEDTNCDFKTIQDRFGLKVANFVKMFTQEPIEDYKQRWQVLLAKIKAKGKEAMLLKIIDANDNLAYVPFIRDEKYLQETLWKHNFLEQELKPFLRKNKIFQDYQKSIQCLKTNL
ncbi:HD domain-containing protein [Candidatus Parcubacteria bacterium]|nr:HD domain-containing protein [Candidatus Parcubacteria bacterium]